MIRSRGGRAHKAILTWVPSLRRAAGAFLVGMALASGCDDSDGPASSVAEGPAIPAATGEEPFAIVAPASYSLVDEGVIAVVGTGARDVKAFAVNVRTDGWYPQTGRLRVSGNLSWEYGPVYLGGSGAFNNHAIEAVLVHSDDSVERSVVEGIVRRD